MDSELLSPSLLWFLFGCALIFIELLTPSLIIFFFGFGAWVAALFAAYTDVSFNVQLMTFIASSLVFLLLLRNKVRELMGEQMKLRTHMSRMTSRGESCSWSSRSHPPREVRLTSTAHSGARRVTSVSRSVSTLISSEKRASRSR